MASCWKTAFLFYCTISTTSSVTGHKRPWTEPICKIITVTGGPWTCYQTRCLFIIIKWNININILLFVLGLLCVLCFQMPFLCNIHKPTALSHGSNCHHLWAMNLSWTWKISITDHAIGHTPWTCGWNGTVDPINPSWPPSNHVNALPRKCSSEEELFACMCGCSQIPTEELIGDP